MKIEIEVPDGHVIDQVTFKKKLPETWEELGEVEGWFVGWDSNLVELNLIPANDSNRNIFATKEQAEASIALAQLSQLMKVYNEGWTPDWDDSDEEKWCVYFYAEEIKLDSSYLVQCFLHFKDKSTAELFLTKFADLIEKAKPLL